MYLTWTDVLGEHDVWAWVWGTLMALTWLVIIVCAVWLALLHTHDKHSASRRQGPADDRPPDSDERTPARRREPELVG
jgi:hypothetical protein